ncbi:MAG: 5'-methylthioadenosine/adenosylhomocysteine nucleosidase [Eubacteriales bacterium]|nr:5'-methylthioadenosine/adenosylhomocysteine nucleosidase [Eubacteriales bacterium]
MKKIGIIGAMEVEVAALKEAMEVKRTVEKAQMSFVEGLLEDCEVVVVRSGIGKVNAAVCTQILADEFHVDAVINTGIAGSLKAEINIGDIVISTDLVHHDMDARGFGYPAGQVPQMEIFAFKADENLRKTAKEVSMKVNPDIKVFEGRIVSGDQFICDKQTKENISTVFGGYCTEMEGAAIAHTAYLNELPFVIIRAISDKADDSANMDYEVFEKMAVANSIRLVKGILREFSKKA